MYKKISRKTIVIISIIVAIVLVGSYLAYSFVIKKDGITTDVNKMVAQAEMLYAKGDKENAYYQMQLYCQEKPKDYDAWMILGDWSLQDGNSDQALKYYEKAANVYEDEDEDLSQSKTVNTTKTNSDKLSFKIRPLAKYTKGMTLSFVGENLVSDKKNTGRVNSSQKDLVDDENYLTTAWFPVDSSKKTLTMTGGFNFAHWQFSDENGNMVSNSIDKNHFRVIGSIRFANNSAATVLIPKSATFARVTYMDKTKTETNLTEDKLTIIHGSVFSGYTDRKSQTFEIPDLNDNQYIEYKDGKWTFFDGEKVTNLDYEKIAAQKGSTVYIQGELCGLVDMNVEEVTEVDKTKQYGVRYNTNDGNAMCERIDDAKGMRFNYTVDDEWINDGENDFDNAYPWCEMKLCNVSTKSDGTQDIAYEDDAKFSKDGSNGNVMVEIPKFYSKRVVQDGYEYLWISGTQHDGYVLDPAFEAADGEELDYIYVGAYLSSQNSKSLVSVSGLYPAINVPYEEILRQAEANGAGYQEMDYLTYNAVQRLFLVETATIDSSSLFAGDTANYYFYPDSEKSAFAVQDQEKSNYIVLKQSSIQSRFSEGDSIAIFRDWSEYNNNGDYSREITKIIENPSEETFTVEFSGKPINIVKGKTAITNISRQCGKTDEEEYCTGAENRATGKASFKYRGIENLYGSAGVALDGAYVYDGMFYYEDANSNEIMVETPVTMDDEFVSDYKEMDKRFCIKQMTYDEENPLIMMPSKIGNNASSTTYYGDLWRFSITDEPLYLTVGGGSDNFRLSGIFSMRTIDNTDSNYWMGGRLIYK